LDEVASEEKLAIGSEAAIRDAGEFSWQNFQL